MGSSSQLINGVTFADVARQFYLLDALNAQVVKGGSLDLTTIKPFDKAPADQREILGAVVKKILNVGPTITPTEVHDEWISAMKRNGWTRGAYSETPGQKQHPLLVPYDDLPTQDQLRPANFIILTRALTMEVAQGQGQPVGTTTDVRELTY